SIAENDGHWLAISALDAKDRHALVCGSLGILAQPDPLGGRLAAIQREVRAADAESEADWLHLAERLADDRDDLVFGGSGVNQIVFEALTSRAVLIGRVRRVDRRRPRVIVRGEQNEVLARQIVLGLDPVGYTDCEGAAKLDDVAGHKYNPGAAPVRKG